MRNLAVAPCLQEATATWNPKPSLQSICRKLAEPHFGTDSYISTQSIQEPTLDFLVFNLTPENEVMIVCLCGHHHESQLL